MAGHISQHGSAASRQGHRNRDPAWRSRQGPQISRLFQCHENGRLLPLLTSPGAVPSPYSSPFLSLRAECCDVVALSYSLTAAV